MKTQVDYEELKVLREKAESYDALMGHIRQRVEMLTLTYSNHKHIRDVCKPEHRVIHSIVMGVTSGFQIWLESILLYAEAGVLKETLDENKDRS